MRDFLGGKVFNDPSAGKMPDHVVSIVGWGVEDEVEFWIVRNSWGAYWGEGGFFRVATGSNQLALESGVAWANPGSWTVHNKPCSEDGAKCGGEVNDLYDGGKKKMTFEGEEYVDPSVYLAAPNVATE